MISEFDQSFFTQGKHGPWTFQENHPKNVLKEISLFGILLQMLWTIIQLPMYYSGPLDLTPASSYWMVITYCC